MKIRQLLSAAAGALLISMAASNLVAQSSSSIIGTLTDPSGAVVVNATVTVTETKTSARQTARSNDQGLFRVLDLLPGAYALHAEAQGFKVLDIANITLDSGQIRDVGKLTLEIGATSESISVTAEATPVQTASSERSDTINGSQLNDIALKGRDTFGYMKLVPGVVDTTVDRSLAGPGSVGGIYINGMASSTKNVTFDGVSELDQGGANAVYVNPSMDAVSEVKV